jgi:transcription antitermination factor NusG
MPILKREPDIYPEGLLANEELLSSDNCSWWCIYTISRREKELMRHLRANEISFYGPVVAKRYRSGSGRLRTSYIPLFANYVFMFADEAQRREALTSNCVSKCSVVEDGERLVSDLAQIHKILESDVPLTAEAKLESGNLVRVKNGPFEGFEGIVIRREGRTRLLLSIHFLEQGVSAEMDEAQVEPLS